jgi:4-hydroxybenzoate polyprenyltransferase
MVLAGYLRGRSGGIIPGFILSPSHLPLYSLLLYTMLMGFIYALNQMTDVESDAANEKLYLVADGYVGRMALMIEMSLLLLASGAMAVARYGVRSAYLKLWIFSVIMGILYSVRPFRLKGKPFLDLFSNALGYGCIAFGIGWLSGSGYSHDIWRRSIPYFLCVGATFVNTTLLDVKGDQAVGDRTVGVVLGLKRSCRLSLALLIAAAISALYLKDIVVTSATLISLPFFVRMVSKLDLSAVSSATRWGITSISLIIGIFIPMYILWLFMLLFFVRWYYRVRFGIRYP